MTERTTIEEGEVIRAGADRISIRIPRKDACSACGLCLCGSDREGMILEAENTLRVVIGDRVELEIPRRDPLAAAGILFGAPMLAFLAGSGAGYALAGCGGLDPEGGAFLLGALSLVGAFFLIRYRERRLREGSRGQVRLVRVVPPPLHPP